MTDPRCLVLRLAGPLQSWGSRSQFNRRETDNEPTKSGVIGLLAAASGRRRGDPIADLVGLRFGVRVDQEGSMLRDYHTVSDLSGRPLLTANVDSKGRQKRSSGKTAKFTAVTQRFYLQDALFLAALEGDEALLGGLAESLLAPTFPLSLGRRSCVPSRPLVVRSDAGLLWSGDLVQVLRDVPWQASAAHRERLRRIRRLPATVWLNATVDEPDGVEVRADVPKSFAHRDRAFSVRNVRHLSIRQLTGERESVTDVSAHDPFELLGW